MLGTKLYIEMASGWGHCPTLIIFIELLALVGYTDDQKQATMIAIADEFEKLGIKRDNVLLVVVEVHGAAWHAAESTDTG